MNLMFDIICIVSKGISSHLMKASASRRRSRLEIRQAKEDEEKERLETKRKLQ